MLTLPPVATLRRLKLNLGGDALLIGGYDSLPPKAKAKANFHKAVANSYKAGKAGVVRQRGPGRTEKMTIYCHDMAAGIPDTEQAIKERYELKLQFPAMSILKNPEGVSLTNCQSSK